MKNIMIRSGRGSTLVEVLVSIILIGVLMFGATKFFVVAWRLDAEQQQYLDILNNVANMIEFARANNLETGTTRDFNNGFRGIYLYYNLSVDMLNLASISGYTNKCNIFKCNLKVKNTGKDYLEECILRAAYYEKWPRQERLP